MNEALREPVGVLGVGVEGRATIDYLVRTGIRDIVALDQNKVSDLPSTVKQISGERYCDPLADCATVFRSPGIHPNLPALVAAKNRGTDITSAVSYFLKHCSAPVIGVTGTVGKGTTASLIAAMLEQAGYRTHLGGNIGKSPLEFMDSISPNERVVLELSSFQTMDVQASPHIAVILKTTSEHLDWHTNLDEYLDAKANLLSHQTEEDVVVYNADVNGSVRVARSRANRRLGFSNRGGIEAGIVWNDEGFFLKNGGAIHPLPLRLHEIRLKGRFNRENIAASVLAAHEGGAPLDTACSTAERFSGLSHRLEFVCQADGVHFYNDSYATRPEATLGALSSFSSDRLAIILGGSEKHADFEELASALQQHPNMIHVALIGATARRLEESIRKAGVSSFTMQFYDTLEQAMEGALKSLENKGILLLSPACASFGLFPNYKVRGERFRAKAKSLAGSPG